MIDLKLVQKQPEVLAKALADRHSELDVADFLGAGRPPPRAARGSGSPEKQAQHGLRPRWRPSSVKTRTPGLCWQSWAASPSGSRSWTAQPPGQS